MEKIALVTGASRGIGRAIATELAHRGWAVCIGYRVRQDKAEKLAAELAGEGCRVMTCQADVSRREEVERMVRRVEQTLGPVSLLVNNAGITKDGLMLKMTEQQWDAVLNVNLKSAFNFIHAVTPIMMHQKGGSIINMSSVVGVHGNAGQCNYSASKAGMIGLAKSIAQELGPKGVRANAVAPGFIKTAMTAQLPEDIRKDWMKKIPLRRGGQTEDIANVCLFLASDLSSYVSGQVIQIDGGMNM